MIKVEKINVYNFEGAIRGMRNPFNSWKLSDSTEAAWGRNEELVHEFYIGPKDLMLMHKLYKAGPEHAKYLRQIFVSMDITAPLYWWKEFDTYKVGTTANSTSTMHKIHDKKFTFDDFSHEHLDEGSEEVLNDIISWLNWNRELYNNGHEKEHWWQMIQLLPSSYNQKRTITMTYANVMSMINQRDPHKLDEWCKFVDVLKEMPYVKAIRGELQ